MIHVRGVLACLLWGESSHYTLPRVVAMCDERVLCACLSYAWLCGMYCMLYYVLLRMDRRVQRTMRPKGSQPDWTRGSNELWNWRVPLRYIDRRVLLSYSLEWVVFVRGILGNSLSFVLTVLCGMCFWYLIGSREGTDVIVHTCSRLCWGFLDLNFVEISCWHWDTYDFHEI